MTTAIVHPSRPWLPAINLLLACGAAVLALIAITSDDVGSGSPVSASAPAPSVIADPSSLLDRMATFRDEVAADESCRRARANEPC